jgi:hypothetical protein
VVAVAAAEDVDERRSCFDSRRRVRLNEGQLSDAMRLANEDETSSPRIQATLADLEKNLTRNERAALAFVIIERLRDLNN